MLKTEYYDSKRQILNNGNFLRPKVISKEKHLPLKLAEVNEAGRIKESIN